MFWMMWRRLAWRLFGSPTVLIVWELNGKAFAWPVDMVAGVPILRLAGGNLALLERGGVVSFTQAPVRWLPLIGRVFG